MEANLIAELVRRKCLRVYLPERFPRLGRAAQQRWLDLHADFFARHVTDEVKAVLSRANARKVDLVLARDRDGMLAEIAARVEPEITDSGEGEVEGEVDGEIDAELAVDESSTVSA
jgi:hypothetical protein